MKCFSPRQTRFLLFLALVLAAFSARALTVQIRSEAAPEMGAVTFLELRHEGHAYTVVPPGPGWRNTLATTGAGLRLAAPEGTLQFSLRFTTNTVKAVTASADVLRQHAVPELRDAEKLAELDVFSGDGAGRAADFAYSLQGHAMRCRVAVVPVPGGSVDFVLHCGAEEFAAAQQTLGAFINTFRRTSRTAEELSAKR